VTPRTLVKSCARFGVLAAGLVLARCGSSSPTQPSNATPYTLFSIVTTTAMQEIVVGPGDDVPVIGLAATASGFQQDDVSSRMRLESSNPAVLRIAGNHVVGVSPGMAEVKATFQSLTATAPARVFAPSSIKQLVITGSGPGSNPCWPNEYSRLRAYVVLDDGTTAGTPSGVWRSSAPTVASVDADGQVTCYSPGQATIEISYLGWSKSEQYTVRVPEDALEYRGGAQTGQFERGRFAEISNSGFYVLASGESGKIVQTIADDQGNTVTTSTFAIRRGSGEWQLKSTFTVPLTANSVCDRIIMTIDGSPRVVESPYGGCYRVQ
jgi:hypothetical protein